MVMTKEEKKERNRRNYLKRKAERLGQSGEKIIPKENEEFEEDLRTLGKEIDSFIKIWIRLTEKITSKKKKKPYEDIKE